MSAPAPAPPSQTTTKSGGWPSRWQWVVILVLSAVLWRWVTTESARRQQEYGPWQSTLPMVKRILPDHLTPEHVASMLGKNGPPSEDTLLRSDWKYDAALIETMNLHPILQARLNKDGWGRLYYAVLDFNNDGLVPDPEALLDPKQEGLKQPMLKQRMAIFSAGSDGDPHTWEDNIKNW